MAHVPRPTPAILRSCRRASLNSDAWETVAGLTPSLKSAYDGFVMTHAGVVLSIEASTLPEEDLIGAAGCGRPLASLFSADSLRSLSTTTRYGL
jgi:hypothetical protein